MRDGSAFGLLGRRLVHSWSPLIHARLGSAPYELVELEPDELAPFVRGDASWRGLNVTIPYKRDAALLADRKSARVEELGVANTLVREADGTIFAENTDVLGFAWMLENFCREHLGGSPDEVLHGCEVLVLGSGGASQAVQAALRKTGARIVVISRRGPNTYERLPERHPEAVLVINTTPVGMFPRCPKSPLPFEDLARLSRLRGVLDVVYNPRVTGICLDAERLGLPFQSGLPMLVSQAVRSSELFQGTTIDDALAREVEAEIVAKTTNIVLIGMPGVGKTTTGRALARVLGRPFVDLDGAFEVEMNESAAEFIERAGEEAFRQLETQVAERYCAQSGMVIACGGGIVTREENYPLLHQNSRIVMLERPLDELPLAGRPISGSRGLERLAYERMPLYLGWSDLKIRCSGTATGDAQAIATMLGLGGQCI